MNNEHTDNGEHPAKPNLPDRSDSSSSSSSDNPEMHAPISSRPSLPSRRSSGTLIVPRDSYEVVEHEYEADVGAMSPRRTTEDLEALGRETREELHRQVYTAAITIWVFGFSAYEAVKEEHDKLDSNNKFLQKYIGDLMSTSKITASTSRSKK
ncbi:hypothetical protein F4861DRAFT_538943 [Xylaria intraflava]|nr:hypothetical protein F4861DRAFT_538943 [Xylaria intraflava]